VKTWYDEHGAGSPLVLLHGGLVDTRFFVAVPNQVGSLADDGVLTQEKPHLVNSIVLDFLTNEPVPTIAGIRRARAAAQ
jgi:hypothetical protein